MNLILIEPDELTRDGLARLHGVRAVHLQSVLRVTAGSRVRVGLVDGPRGTAVVTDSIASSVELHCTFDTNPPERPRVDLLLALPRPKVLKRLWAQLAALGVGRIMLTNAARVERNYFDTHVLSPVHYRPLLIEGLQQAQDTCLPIVSIHRQLKVFVEDELGSEDSDVRVCADAGARKGVAATLTSAAAGRVLLAVGPEGGWSDYERRLLRDHRFLPVSMGQRTLRSDTACIALIALVHAALEHQG